VSLTDLLGAPLDRLGALLDLLGALLDRLRGLRHLARGRRRGLGRFPGDLLGGGRVDCGYNGAGAMWLPDPDC